MIITLYDPADIERLFFSLLGSIKSITSVGLGLMTLVLALLIIKPLVSYFISVAQDDRSQVEVMSDFSAEYKLHRGKGRSRK